MPADRPASLPDPVTPPSPGVLAALAWCKLGESHTPLPAPVPHDFLEAATLGLLHPFPGWRVTPQGDGALVAAGLLPGTPGDQHAPVIAVWCVVKDQAPDFVTAFNYDLLELAPQLLQDRRAEAERRHIDDIHRDDRLHARFFTTIAVVDLPTLQ